jgi:MFS family permease
VLDKFYGVGANSVGYYIFAFAIGNFLGPLPLGRFFDSIGRKPMIAGTYILSGVLLTITAILFQSGTLTATSQTAAYGYLLGAALMIGAGIVESVLGVEAAQKQLEDIAKPLTAEDAEAGGDDGGGDIDVDKLKGEDAAPVADHG